MSQSITKQALLATLDEWIAKGQQAVGPVLVRPGLCLYAPLAGSASLVFDGFIRPRNSIKEVIFPRHEELFSYQLGAHDVELVDTPLPDKPMLVMNARPCDAAALPILDHVFNWDDKDDSYNKRRELTTVVTLACESHDSECFCTSVGLGPAAEQGSDVILLPISDGIFEIRTLTPKGEALFSGKTTPSDQTGHAGPGPERKIALEAMNGFIKDHFEDPIWAEMTIRCLSCGACAYTCPTCHCFDIVDEGNAVGGCRVKNWDSCQFCQFTMHASGHNPRSRQAQRQRQRVFHKFHIYPAKFGAILCTGCGNCGRNCPAGIGMLGTLMELSRAAQASPAGTSQ